MTVYRKDVVNFESVSQTTLTPSVDLGARRIEAGKEYIYVYNDGGASITSGYGVTVSGNSGYSVTVSSVININPCVGVANYTVATGVYGWIQTKGPCQIAMSTTVAATIGTVVYLDTNGTFHNVVLVNSGATAVQQPAGVLLQTVTSIASGKIYLRGLFA